MTSDILFELLPDEIKEHFANGGTAMDLDDSVRISNYLEYLDEGADRTVYALNSDFVVKFETTNADQSLVEFDMYQEYQDENIITKIYSTYELAEKGVIFAERVTPMREFLRWTLGDRKDKRDWYLTDYFDDFSADEESLSSVYEYLWDELDKDVIEELTSFVGSVEMFGLNDMHVDNIGVNRHGKFLALDAGFGH